MFFYFLWLHVNKKYHTWMLGGWHCNPQILGRVSICLISSACSLHDAVDHDILALTLLLSPIFELRRRLCAAQLHSSLVHREWFSVHKRLYKRLTRPPAASLFSKQSTAGMSTNYIFLKSSKENNTNSKTKYISELLILILSNHFELIISCKATFSELTAHTRKHLAYKLCSMQLGDVCRMS